MKKIKEFLKDNPEAKGYRIYDSKTRSEFQEGKLVKDKQEDQYGLHFVAKYSDLFRFVMTNAKENLGDTIAEISLKNAKGRFVKNLKIFRINDTDYSYRASAFYVQATRSLNDYDLVENIYKHAERKYKQLILDPYLFEDSIKYYQKIGFSETVRALKDIRKNL